MWQKPFVMVAGRGHEKHLVKGILWLSGDQGVAGNLSWSHTLRRCSGIIARQTSKGHVRAPKSSTISIGLPSDARTLHRSFTAWLTFVLHSSKVRVNVPCETARLYFIN